MATDYKPNDYRTVTPYLIIRGMDGLITYLKRAFDA